MTDDERDRRIRGTRVVVAAASATVLCCAVASFASVWFAIAGTAACALTALAATYAAFEGFDARLRRGPTTKAT